MKKKKKDIYSKAREKYIHKCKENIDKNKDKIWTPKYNMYKDKYLYTSQQTHSWFKVSKYINRRAKSEQIIFNKNSISETINKSVEINVIFNETNKKIIQKWFNAYTKMYNVAIKYIKDHYADEGFTVSLKNVRKNTLHEKKIIVENSSIYNKNILENKNLTKKEYNNWKKKINTSKIRVHTLDLAIRLACTNYKSAFTNYKRGHIKKFRIRYLKFNRPNKILNFEYQEFGKKKLYLCESTLGTDSIYTYKQNNKIKDKIASKTINFNGKTIKNVINLKDIISRTKSECILRYCKVTNKYSLFVPIAVDTVETKTSCKRHLSLDPGIRTFMTGLSQNTVYKIGTNVSKKLELYLKRIDYVNNNNNLPKKKKKKIEKICYKKIKNLVDDLHWKVIKYITENHEAILIGDMSVKSIIRKGSVLTKMTKRVASNLRFYTFKQRLEYKCKIKGIQYEEIDERYTSKQCSLCGNIKENLRGAEIYNCKKCYIVLDRDVNGCRGIFLKRYLNKN